MTHTETLRLALEALGWTDEWRPQGLKEEAITAIKAALLSRSDGEAKDEPVQNQLMALIDENQRLRAELKFNTTPPQRKPLTDEEIYLCTNHIDRNARGWANEFARAIEAAHDIKE